MRRTQDSVSNALEGKRLPEACSPERAEAVFRRIEGRWKLVILYHLFDRGTLRSSELERCIAGISQKMLSQQLRVMERDGIVARTVYRRFRRRSSTG